MAGILFLLLRGLWNLQCYLILYLHVSVNCYMIQLRRINIDLTYAYISCLYLLNVAVRTCSLKGLQTATFLRRFKELKMLESWEEHKCWSNPGGLTTSLEDTERWRFELGPFLRLPWIGDVLSQNRKQIFPPPGEFNRTVLHKPFSPRRLC